MSQITEMKQFIQASQSLCETVLFESAHMLLKHIADVKVNFQDADFWIQRKGSELTVGTPTHNYSPEHIGVKVTDTSVVLPAYLFYAIQHLHNQGYFKPLARGTLRLQHIKTDDVQNIPLAQRNSDLDEAETKTKTKTQTATDSRLDDLLNPSTDTLPSKVDQKSQTPQTVSVKKASAADTMRAMQNMVPNDQMLDAMSRLRDIEIPDDEVDVGYYDVPDVTTETLPVVVTKELRTHGVQSPDFHQVASLPGNINRAIRYTGKKLFSTMTNTPTEDVYMIGNLSGMGPNSHEEVNAVAGWITENGEKVTGLSDVDFSGILPGYRAEYQMYTAGGVRWLLIQDFMDNQYMGKYIYMWPEQDSKDVWNLKGLENRDKALESHTMRTLMNTVNSLFSE